MRLTAAIALSLIATLALSGCSQSGVYAGLREGQRQECLKQPEAREREQCLQDAGENYRDYQRSRDAAPH